MDADVSTVVTINSSIFHNIAVGCRGLPCRKITHHSRHFLQCDGDGDGEGEGDSGVLDDSRLQFFLLRILRKVDDRLAIVQGMEPQIGFLDSADA